METLTSCFAIFPLSDVLCQRLIKPNLWFVFGRKKSSSSRISCRIPSSRCFPRSYHAVSSSFPIFMHLYLGHVKSAKESSRMVSNVLSRFVKITFFLFKFQQFFLIKSLINCLKKLKVTQPTNQPLIIITHQTSCFPKRNIYQSIMTEWNASLSDAQTVWVSVYLIPSIKHTEMMLMVQTLRILESDDERMKRALSHSYWISLK